jgi:peptide/nickel transport system substrate-binding protein
MAGREGGGPDRGVAFPGGSGARRISRRRLLGGATAGTALLASAGALGGALGLEGCSSGPASLPPSARGSGRSHGPSGPPRRGGRLRVGTTSEIDGFSPFTDHWDNTGLTYANTVYDTLTAITADGRAVPYLAQSVTPNADRTVWTVTLRPGIRFHDGTPLDSSVLVANVEGFMSSLLTAPALKPIAGARAVGPLSVEILCKEPLVSFPYYLSTQVGVVVAPSMINPPAGTTPRPVGTGPFVYQEWVPNSHFEATRNPNYWRSGLPYLDSVTYFPIVDDGARLDSLLSGEIDLMVSTNPDVVTGLAGKDGYQRVDTLHRYVGEPDMDFIMLNTAVEPTNDLAVRQALASAMDTKALVKLFDDGLTEPSNGLFPPGSVYYAPTGYPSYDLARARALVEQAKPRHGGRIALQLGTIPNPRDVRATEAIQSMWQAAGIEVTLAQIDQATFITNALTGHFQAYTWEQFSAADPDLNYVWWSTTTIGPVGGLSLNFARNADPVIQAALQRGREDPDPAVRIAAYRTVNERFALDLPYLWISRTVWSAAASSRVGTFQGGTLPGGEEAESFTGGVLSPVETWLAE